MKARPAALGMLGLIILAACAILLAPAEAQQTAPRIGVLVAGPASCPATSITRVFRQALTTSGFSEGRDFVLDRRCYSTDDMARKVAVELLKQNPTVLVASGNPPAHAIKGMTTIPVVFVNVADPVGTGLVQSLARPGTNMTGLADITHELNPKRVEILKEALPVIRRLATLFAPAGPGSEGFQTEINRAAAALGIELRHFAARRADELPGVFDAMKQEGCEAVIVLQSPLFWTERARITDLAIKHRLPSMYPWRPPVEEEGGLVSFGADQAALYRQAAGYVVRILKGFKPADLPVEQPTKFELVINLKTAKALGLTIPPSLLLRADQVIE